MAKKANEQKNKVLDYEKLKKSIAPLAKSSIDFKDPSQITNQEWVELKEAVSPVNNFITSELTKKFIRLLPTLFPREAINVEKLLGDLNNVNGKGYDFRDDSLKIVAEVKANRPYKGERFGADQKDGIKKDVTGLLEGKKSEGLSKEELKDYYKFQIMMKYEKEGEGISTLKAIQNLWPNTDIREHVDCSLLVGDMSTKPKDKVYFLLLGI